MLQNSVCDYVALGFINTTENFIIRWYNNAHTHNAPTWKFARIHNIFNGDKRKKQPISVCHSLSVLCTRGGVYAWVWLLCTIICPHYSILNQKQKKRTFFPFSGFIFLFRCVIIECHIHVILCHPEIGNSCY